MIFKVKTSSMMALFFSFFYAYGLRYISHIIEALCFAVIKTINLEIACLLHNTILFLSSNEPSAAEDVNNSSAHEHDHEIQDFQNLTTPELIFRYYYHDLQRYSYAFGFVALDSLVMSSKFSNMIESITYPIEAVSHIAGSDNFPNFLREFFEMAEVAHSVTHIIDALSPYSKIYSMNPIDKQHEIEHIVEDLLEEFTLLQAVVNIPQYIISSYNPAFNAEYVPVKYEYKDQSLVKCRNNSQETCHDNELIEYDVSSIILYEESAIDSVI